MEKFFLFVGSIFNICLMTTAISLLLFYCFREETYKYERYGFTMVEKIENKNFDQYLNRLNKLYELGLINSEPTRVKVKYIPEYYCRNLVVAINNISKKYMEFQSESRSISNLFKIRYFIFYGITIVSTIIYYNIGTKGSLDAVMAFGLIAPSISLWIMHKIIRKKADNFFKEVEFKYGYDNIDEFKTKI